MTKKAEVERFGLPDLFELWNRPNFGFAGRLNRLMEEPELKVEEYREDGTLVIRADLPGIDPDKDVQMTVTDGVLHLRAERREEKETSDRDYRRTEIRYGAFSRTLPLPPGAVDDDVKASYKDGVLEVRVPVKAELTAPKSIPIARG